MGGENDGKGAQAQVADEPQAQSDQAAAQQAQVTGGAGSAGGDDADKARADYEAALRERATSRRRGHCSPTTRTT